VITLDPSRSYIVIHSFSFSDNPFRVNGTNQLVIYDAGGAVINIWDGKDGSGVIVLSGTYTVQVRTKDKDGNEFTVNKILDIVADNSYDVSVKVYYSASDMTIFGDAVNAQDFSIKIYNIKGELIISRRLQTAANKYSMIWDMRTAGGNKAAHGMYVVVAEFKDSKTGIITRKFEKMAVKQ
jgi:flagellar hook assembly protein FlgD